MRAPRIFVAAAVAINACHAWSGDPPKHSPELGRRAFVDSTTVIGSLLALTANGSPVFAAWSSKIGQRLEEDKLVTDRRYFRANWPGRPCWPMRRESLGSGLDRLLLANRPNHTHLESSHSC